MGVSDTDLPLCAWRRCPPTSLQIGETTCASYPLLLWDRTKAGTGPSHRHCSVGSQAPVNTEPDSSPLPLGSGGLSVASEPQEDRVHFLVLTDVCGNRTYGVVAQYYRAPQVHEYGSHGPDLSPRGYANTQSMSHHIQSGGCCCPPKQPPPQPSPASPLIPPALGCSVAVLGGCIPWLFLGLCLSSWKSSCESCPVAELQRPPGSPRLPQGPPGSSQDPGHLQARPTEGGVGVGCPSVGSVAGCTRDFGDPGVAVLHVALIDCGPSPG